MEKPHDLSRFAALLTGAAELYGKELSSTAMEVWWNALCEHDFAVVADSFDAHLRDPERGRFMPTPADILGHIANSDGHPGAEEAWAIVCPLLGDEAVTVFWTRPMQLAYGAAATLADDPIAARMAFKEVYARELAAARRRGERPQWQISPGRDAAMRKDAIEAAVRKGQIGLAQAARLLPPAGNADGVAMLAAHTVCDEPQSSPRALAALAAIRRMLSTKTSQRRS